MAAARVPCAVGTYQLLKLLTLAHASAPHASALAMADPCPPPCGTPCCSPVPRPSRGPLPLPTPAFSVCAACLFARAARRPKALAHRRPTPRRAGAAAEGPAMPPAAHPARAWLCTWQPCDVLSLPQTSPLVVLLAPPLPLHPCPYNVYPAVAPPLRSCRLPRLPMGQAAHVRLRTLVETGWYMRARRKKNSNSRAWRHTGAFTRRGPLRPLPAQPARIPPARPGAAGGAPQPQASSHLPTRLNPARPPLRAGAPPAPGCCSGHGPRPPTLAFPRMSRARLSAGFPFAAPQATK